jgi:tRNA(fMet)-specific endonuclease VapC
MSIPYLLDTQIVSYSGNNHPFVELYRDILDSDAILFVALQSVAEIYFGARKANWGTIKMELLGKTLETYRVLNPQIDTAKIWAELMVASRKQGRPMSLQDSWVAATAVSFELPLVSHDNDFIEFPGLNLIRRKS